MSPEKLNLGLAGYGRATAEAGPFTKEKSILGISIEKILNKIFQLIFIHKLIMKYAYFYVKNGKVVMMIK
jgi:hypothetical protein